MPSRDRLLITRADQLNGESIVEIALGRQRIVLDDALLRWLSERRRSMLQALEATRAVYGVNTGTGAQSHLRLSESTLRERQNNLMLARAVGGPPWLDRTECRSLIAVRLRTFLEGDAGVSAELCRQLASVLNSNMWPAVPRRHSGSAGEIIPLAHAFGPLTAIGECLATTTSSAEIRAEAAHRLPSGLALKKAGLEPYSLGLKEGIALLQGVPGATGLSILLIHQTRTLIHQMTCVAAVGISLLRVNRDPYRLSTARGDGVLMAVLENLWPLIGSEASPRTLQAPVSFRVLGHVLAHMTRTANHLEGATERAMKGVTDSPAFIDGQFVGTAGFHGVELAGTLSSLAAAVAHAAEVSAARSHRYLDPDVTGLPHQLSHHPGTQAGLVVVHKRAAAAIHELRHIAQPTIVGGIETSLGQEDIQTFSWRGAQILREVLTGAREVIACELLILHQAHQLAQKQHVDSGPLLTPVLDGLMSKVAQALPSGANDRPYGRDIETLLELLGTGWGENPEGERADSTD